ncbi:hypothetical protein B0H12DRAFT_1304722 [Mycena haematopus]|nr:hypothetical protein B0H12DRAFT_1304722 [Mycena haematopus]
MAQCPSCPTITPLFRSFNSPEWDHFYTANASEMVSFTTSGYNLEGVAAGILPTQVAGSTPFFRLFNSAIVDHAYTANATEVKTLVAAGYVLETSPGFVYTNQSCGGVPLYGLFLPNKDHFYTTQASERNTAIEELGYTDLGIAAYVPVSGIITGHNTC